MLLSKIYHRYNDNKKLEKVIKIETYLIVLFFSLDLLKNIKTDPIKGSKIKEDKIGKFIN
tara:strand:- start:1186 stop:1365 length:180 start_codon:yes stop_codon:yes gene_type:complete